MQIVMQKVGLDSLKARCLQWNKISTLRGITFEGNFIYCILRYLNRGIIRG